MDYSENRHQVPKLNGASEAKLTTINLLTGSLVGQRLFRSVAANHVGNQPAPYYPTMIIGEKEATVHVGKVILRIGAGKSEKERRIRIFEELTDNGEELKKDKVNGEGNVNSYRVSRKMRRREIAS
ncbi:hypothetical protein T03_11783 [Trichinella britovi]|uniref:Uncharacterized protein n=1 Tax=Trichinella britovi TaxID=45882 RepID=A0A0V1D8X6_TRIBR|nr:hypothetical protein T03_11783 [Trichinella britovi]